MMRLLLDIWRRWRARPVVKRIAGVDLAGRWS